MSSRPSAAAFLSRLPSRVEHEDRPDLPRSQAWSSQASARAPAKRQLLGAQCAPSLASEMGHKEPLRRTPRGCSRAQGVSAPGDPFLNKRGLHPARTRLSSCQPPRPAALQPLHPPAAPASALASVSCPHSPRGLLKQPSELRLPRSSPQGPGSVSSLAPLPGPLGWQGPAPISQGERP